MIGGYGFGGLGMFLPLIYMIIIFAGIYLLFDFTRKTNGNHSINHAVSLLDSRYIQGVLSDEEYEKMKDILNSSK